MVPAEFAPVMERLAQNYYICPSTPAQYAALECFTPQSLAVAEDRREEFARRRAVVLEGLAAAGLPVPVPPDGAFYVYFDVSGTGLSAWDFCERVLAEKHVALTPGKDFGRIGADRYVRLSYSASVGELREGLSRLAEFTDSLNQGRSSGTLCPRASSMSHVHPGRPARTQRGENSPVVLDLVEIGGGQFGRGNAENGARDSVTNFTQTDDWVTVAATRRHDGRVGDGQPVLPVPRNRVRASLQ